MHKLLRPVFKRVQQQRGNRFLGFLWAVSSYIVDAAARATKRGGTVDWGTTWPKRATALGVTGAVLALGACGGSSSKTSTTPTTTKLTEAQIIAQASPSVVQLIGTQGQNTISGTGVIINAAKSLVLTNAHVVSGVASLKARLSDQSEIPAQIVSQAPCDDLAVVRLVTPPAGLKALSLGDSSTLKAGDNVTVLGFPETLDTSGGPQKLISTSGNVSQPNTSASIDAKYIKYPSLIVHQAAINHGNSGGPLVDDQGKLVGINTLTAAGAGSGQIQGQYYSIAINRAKAVLPQLESGHSIANMGWNLTPIDQTYIAKQFGASLGQRVVNYLNQVGDTQGMIVNGVDPGSPASKGNITPGDYLSKINGAPVTSVQSVCDVVQSAPTGSTLHLNGRYMGDASQFNKNIGVAWVSNLKVP